MIIENGTILVKERDAVSMDFATGFPAYENGVYSRAIACQYIPDNIDHSNMTNNEHVRKASYTILIDLQDFPYYGTLKLMDIRGHELGEFSIVSIEALVAVCQLKIKV